MTFFESLKDLVFIIYSLTICSDEIVVQLVPTFQFTAVHLSSKFDGLLFFFFETTRVISISTFVAIKDTLINTS